MAKSWTFSILHVLRSLWVKNRRTRPTARGRAPGNRSFRLERRHHHHQQQQQPLQPQPTTTTNNKQQQKTFRSFVGARRHANFYSYLQPRVVIWHFPKFFGIASNLRHSGLPVESHGLQQCFQSGTIQILFFLALPKELCVTGMASCDLGVHVPEKILLRNSTRVCMCPPHPPHPPCSPPQK